MKTVAQTFGTRRELLKLGGLGLAYAGVEGVTPSRAWATQTKGATPRGSARNVLFYEINGAISHLESWDFKEDAGTPADIDVEKIKDNLWISNTLFPEFKHHIDKFAIHRTLLSHEEVHFRGQYYVQTGRPLNLAFAREIPAIGSVLAMELEPRRGPADTFPVYMSFNLEKAFPGALSTGFLDPRFSVVDINPELVGKGAALDDSAIQLIEERWRLLTKLREAQRGAINSRGREMAGYESFYDAAYQILSDERWPAAFRVTAEDRERYGDHAAGIGCILARNVLQADAGTHYVHICHPGWDHHVSIFDREAKTSHYKLCAEFDQAFSALMEDLSTRTTAARPDKTLLDETLVVAMSEFGRTPGALNPMAGRDHYNKVFPALFAGAGVQPGLILGASDAAGEKCLDTGWHRKEQPRIENVVSTMFSALGVDWTKEIRPTPSGRGYAYVDKLGAPGLIPIDEISSIYG
jgi:hypothetical protein